MRDDQSGIYRKYKVIRLNDADEKHTDCEFFVLDWSHDKFAITAMKAYADACKDEYPELARDIAHYIKVYAK
jgi:hypothetical protein